MPPLVPGEEGDAGTTLLGTLVSSLLAWTARSSSHYCGAGRRRNRTPIAGSRSQNLPPGVTSSPQLLWLMLKKYLLPGGQDCREPCTFDIFLDSASFISA